MKISCYKPANGETCVIKTNPPLTVDMPIKILKRCLAANKKVGGKSCKLIQAPLMCKNNKYVWKDVWLIKLKLSNKVIYLKRTAQPFETLVVNKLLLAFNCYF